MSINTTNTSQNGIGFNRGGASSDNGRTHLHVAAEEGHVIVVKMLLEHGLKVNAKDSSGNTPLTLAIKGSHVKVVRLLAKNKNTEISSDDLVAVQHVPDKTNRNCIYTLLSKTTIPENPNKNLTVENLRLHNLSYGIED